MKSIVHLSLGVKSTSKSLGFFVNVLGGEVLYRDPSGYINLDVRGARITLKETPNINPDLPEFHFGFYLSLKEFDELAETIMKTHSIYVEGEPTVVDQNTPRERKKMYLREPTGYLVELQGL